MPADRHERRRAPTLPDELVFWIGALWLAVTTAGRLLLLTDATVGRWLSRTAWPLVQRVAVGAGRRAARAATRVAHGARVRRWGRRTLGAGAFAVALVGVLVLASGPLIGAIAGLVVGRGAADDLPVLDQTSVVLASDGTPLGVVERERRREVDSASLPAHVPAVVLAAEDHRFEDHEGYDLRGLVRAAVTNARAGEVEQGGSTITQQLAKLNFTGGDESMSRKVEELLYAVRLEEELTKEQLLERYLNQVYFGNGAHGIAAAAEEYFAVQPQDLTVSQAAALAGVIQRPGTLDPRTNPDAVRHRRDAVLARAVDEGLLRRDEAAAAAAEPLTLAPHVPRPRTDPILDAVRSEVRTIEQLGATPEERMARLESGGLRVETTLDPALQHTAAEAIAATFPEGTGPTAAVAAVDPRSGAIRALRSGQDGAGGFDLARQGRRQPGSTFKPLTAVAALEEGLSPKQGLVGDGPIELEHGGPEPWQVDNFDGTDLGTVDLREALRRSVNTAFAQIGVAVGVDAMADVVDRVGIDADAALGEPEQRGPSVALGGIAHGVSPLELATAYTAFAADGRVADPHLVHRIVDADGDVVFERDEAGEQVIDRAVTRQVRSMLEDALATGTGRAARIPGVPAFGKTGTSQDGADAWFVGSTSDLTTAVWVGHPEGRVSMPKATGGTLAAPIWRAVTSTWTASHPADVWPAPTTSASEGDGLTLPKPERVRAAGR